MSSPFLLRGVSLACSSALAPALPMLNWLLLAVITVTAPAGESDSPAQPPRDGKLSRSELWQPFDVRTAKADFFVSPEGRDDWSGTLAAPNAAYSDGPFATLARAQQAVRKLKRQVFQPKEPAIDPRYIGTPYPFGKGKDILVFVRQGFYSLTEPLEFSAEDGGERVETTLPSGAFEWHHLRDHYVTYAAFPGEQAVISGATLVTGWKRARLVWTAPFHPGQASSLVADGKKQILARTPNTGYFTLRRTPQSTREIPYRPGDIRRWNGMEDNRIVILLRWRTAYNSIAEVDERNQVARLAQPEDGPGGNNGLLVVPPRYYSSVNSIGHTWSHKKGPDKAPIVLDLG